jgi:uncharacterized protein YrzB (UPF0473 family)
MSDMEMMDNENVVELVDDSGEKAKFEHLDTFELNDNTYIILTPLEQADEEESDVYIMRIVQEDGEEILEAVVDEKEVETVFDEFRSRTEGEFEFIG